MTDRELLEFAAKAAGIELLFSTEPGMSPREANSLMYWNPLTDDGDALRLAVKLGLVLNLSPREDCRGQTVVTYQGMSKIEQPCIEGREAAARHAIVRAAAEIGKEPQP